MEPQLQQLPIAKVKPAKDNIRQDVGDVAELAASIGAVGVLEPLLACQENGHFTLVAGARRLAGAKLAGLKTVPVIVRNFDEQQRIEAMLIENLQRHDLTPIEEAKAYGRLIDDVGLTQRDLAARVGRGQGHISKRLALLELPANVQTEVDSGGITLDEARELTKLKNMPKRLTAALREGKRYGSIERAVRVELQDHERAERAGQALQKLKQSGVRIVEFRKNGTYNTWELPKGAIRLEHWEARELKISVAGHKKEPCHAAAIEPRLGEVIYVCTDPKRHKSNDGKTVLPEGEKEARAAERAKEKQQQLRAREKNIKLGELLERKLRAPKIDARNMRLLADLVMHEIGSELAQCSFRYTDEASQTVVEKKDRTVSRIVHVEGLAARKLIDDRLKAAKTPEEIMGVVLQALVAAQKVDRNAVPPSQRIGYVSALGGGYQAGSSPIRKAVDAIANAIGAGKGSAK